MHNEKGIDIAPKFRNLLAASPLQVLQMLKCGLMESENTSPMITAVLSDINKELQFRFNGMERE